MEARRVFEKMHHCEVVCWNVMILGYAQMEQSELALQMYSRMIQEGQTPDDRTFVGALKACSNLALFEEGTESFGLRAKSQYLGQVRAIHIDAVSRGFDSDLYVGTMLVEVYAKCRSLVDARLVFEKMHHHDVFSWNAIIFGYAQMEEGETALQMYEQMQHEGIIPDDQTFVGALKACGSLAALEKGKDIHAQISCTCLEATDLFVLTTLVDLYGKCGSMVDAQAVFDALPMKDTVIWNTLVAGYVRLGERKVVFDLFQRITKEGIQPDSVTFLSVLTACSHLGLVDQGQKYFESMTRDYDLTPVVEHYNSLVDLLGRAGQLDKAMEMVKTMPFEPSSVLWTSLLGACRKWCNVEVGKQAFECAVRLDTTDAAAYSLMSDIYVAAGMQEAAREIQATRAKAQAWKKPGPSVDLCTHLRSGIENILKGNIYLHSLDISSSR